MNEKTDEQTSCAECELASTWKAAFQVGMTSRNTRGLLCPVCWDKYAADWGAVRIKAIAVMGLIGLIIPSDLLRVFILSCAICYFLTVGLTPLHELAHACAAWLLGFRVYKIQVGWRGRRWFQFRIGRCLWEFRRVPLGGFVECATSWPHFIRLRHLVMVSAGPLLHLSLIVLAWNVQTENVWIGWFALLLIISNLADLWITLQLWRFNKSDEQLVTDGTILVGLLVAPSSELKMYPIHYYWLECQELIRRDEDEAAMALSLEGLKRFPDDPSLETMQGASLMGLERYEEAREIFVRLRGLPESSPEYQAMLLNNIAWANLLSREACRLAEARELSEKAYRILPWEAYINGTRGSVLVETGEVEAGMTLLQQALAENESLSNQSLNALFLARGLSRLGRKHEAVAMYERAKSLDPTCSLLRNGEWGIDLVVDQPRPVVAKNSELAS